MHCEYLLANPSQRLYKMYYLQMYLPSQHIHNYGISTLNDYVCNSIKKKVSELHTIGLDSSNFFRAWSPSRLVRPDVSTDSTFLSSFVIHGS